MKKIDLIPFIIVVALFVIAVYAYPVLPAEIPTHWNAAGEVDGYSSRTIVFLFPVIVLLIALLFHFIPKLAVFRKNVEKFKHFPGMKIAITLFFAAFFLMTLMPNFGYEFNMSTLVLVIVGILFIYIGYIIKDVKRNFWIGIRTPWTLSDDFVWKKTHKMGSKMFIMVGILLLLSILLGGPSVWFLIILVLAAVFYTYWYSYILYRNRHK